MKIVATCNVFRWAGTAIYRTWLVIMF